MASHFSSKKKKVTPSLWQGILLNLCISTFLFAAEKQDLRNPFTLPLELQLSVLEYIPCTDQQQTLSLVSKDMYQLVFHKNAPVALDIDYESFSEKLKEFTASYPVKSATDLWRILLRPQYQEVHLKNFPFKEISSIADALNPLVRLKVLGLRLNRDESSALRDLGNILQHPSLEIAYIDVGGASSQQIEALKTALKKTPLKLRKLFLDVEAASIISKIALLEGLEGNQTLTHLQFAKIYDFLSPYTLESIIYQPFVTDGKEMKAMIKYLMTHPQLDSYLLPPHLPFRFSPPLFLSALQAISDHPGLKNVSVSIDALDEKGGKLLAKIIENKTLDFFEVFSPRKLKTDHRGIGISEVSEEKLKIDATNDSWIGALGISKITSLNIMGFDFTAESFDKLCQSLSQPSNYLSRFQLADYKVSPRQVTALIESFMTSKRPLHILGLPISLLAEKPEEIGPSLEKILSIHTLKELRFGPLSVLVKKINSQSFQQKTAVFYENMIRQLFMMKQVNNAYRWALYTVEKNLFLSSDNNLFEMGKYFWEAQLTERQTAIIWGKYFLTILLQKYKNREEIIHHPFLNAWLGSYYAAQQDYQNAKVFFDIAFKNEERINKAILYYMGALTYYANKEYSKSSAAFNRYFAIEQESIPAIYYLAAGEAYFQNNDNEAAVKAYEKGLSQTRVFNVRYYQNLSKALIGIKDYPKAIFYLQKIEERPFLEEGSAPWYLNDQLLGVAYFYNQNYDLAIKQFEKIIHKGGDFPVSIYYHAGQAAIDLKQWNKAISFYAEGIKKDRKEDLPTLNVACLNLGTSYYFTQQWLCAIKGYQTLSEALWPEHIRYRVGYSYAQAWLKEETNHTYKHSALKYLKPLCIRMEENKIALLGTDRQEFELIISKLLQE